MKTLATLAAALLLGSAAAAPDAKVEITAKGFVPAVLEIGQGQKVIWMNMTTADHTVTESGKRPGSPDAQGEKPLFDSGKIAPGATFEFTFTQPGSYAYGCTVDRSMSGKIVVKPKP